MSLIKRLLLSPPRCTSSEQLQKSVQGKTVLITGASFGIGEAATYLLAQAGAEVVLVARTREKLEHIVSDILQKGGKASAYPADLYKTEKVSELMQMIQIHHPRIDILISNAGKSIRRPITEALKRDDLARSLALNFSSPAGIIMALLPAMLAQGGGQMINISSVSARHLPAPQWASYQSTKTGFDLWFRAVAAELQSKHMVMTSVYMPLVRTRMIAPSKMYDHWPALSALEAAEVIAHAIVSRKERLAPWWLGWIEMFSLFFRQPLSRLLTFITQRSK